MPENQDYCSRSVESNQAGVHDKLDELVLKYIRTRYLKPIQTHNQRAFDCLLAKLQKTNHSGLVLDSCCGTGLSTILLARKNPKKLVIGIDQSENRLNKKKAEGEVPENCIWLRANCEDIWRLCVAQGIQFDKHYILYPNPWPKSEHVKRRWHGHPVFPILKQLSPVTELRSNWKIYLLEFARAWQLLTGKQCEVKEYEFQIALTLFEKKYAASKQKLFRLVCNEG